MATTFLSPSAPALNETEQRNLGVVNEMIDRLNAHDPEGMLACMDDDMEWFDVPMEVPYRGKAAIGAFLEELFEAFPDLRYTPTNIIVRGDRLSVEFRMFGTHSNTFYGLPATYKTLDLPCHTAVVMRGDKILSDYCYFDNSMILRQLGLMPSLAVTLSRPGRVVLWAAVKSRRFAPFVAGAAIVGVAVTGIRRMLKK